jgi:MFS transporter
MTEAGRDLSGVWARPQRSLTVGLLLTISATAFEALAVATVLPATVTDLGGLGFYGWVFSGFMLCNLVSIAVSGRLADHGGIARPFVGGSALFVAGLIIAGLAPSMGVVVVGRMAQGLGAGAISCVSYMAVARGYPTSARPRMLALLSSAWVVPGLIGPTLAGSVADYLSWRWVFLGLAPLTAIAASVAVIGLRRLAPQDGAPPDPGRIALAIRLAIGTALVYWGRRSFDRAHDSVCGRWSPNRIPRTARTATCGNPSCDVRYACRDRLAGSPQFCLLRYRGIRASLADGGSGTAGDGCRPGAHGCNSGLDNWSLASSTPFASPRSPPAEPHWPHAHLPRDCGNGERAQG